MKLVASLLVRNELGRYLEPCILHLLEFVDEVRVLDDASTDGSFEWLADQGPHVQVLQLPRPHFFEHEGRTRQALLEWTLKGDPSHIVSIDCDEFVNDGPGLRRSIEFADRAAFGLTMEEVWEADVGGLCVREDGGWRSHPVPALWRIPERLDARWRIADRALACGRVPVAIDGIQPVLLADHSLLHFGWANEQERQARYDRYRVADGGRFHASQHLESIMWGCDRVQLRPRGWPAGLLPWKDAILERANRPSNIHESIPG